MDTDEASAGLKRELRTNQIGMGICAVIGLSSLLMGVITDSVALTLDSSEWGVGVITGFMYQRIIKTLEKSPDEKYHFGYAKYEPLVVAIEGLLILSSCVVSIKFAIQDLVNPETPGSYLPAVLLTGLTGVVALAMGWYTRRVGRQVQSPVLAAGGLAWYLDGLLAFGLAAGFGVGMVMAQTGFSARTVHNLDPIMALCLALLMIVPPARMVRSNMLELLDANPGAEVERSVKEFVERFRVEFALADVKRVRLRKAGRRLFMNVAFISEGATTIEEMDRIAHQFTARAREAFGSVDATVYFDTHRTPTAVQRTIDR
jgi:cation diffusion facilitator family transporter